MYAPFKKPNSLLKKLGNLTTSFGGKTRGENFHQGLDVANKSGTTIPALSSGVITGVGATNNGFGNVVTLKDTNGNTHQYSHLQKALKRPGQIVKKGQPIASMGNSGNSYSESGNDSSHLDLRISNSYGRYFNPLTYLKNK